MIKYTILYKNGKAWNGKATDISEIPVVDCVLMFTRGEGYQRLWEPAYSREQCYLYWGVIGSKRLNNKVRTPNPKSKTKKQKAFDEAYAKWVLVQRGIVNISIAAYKRWLYEQKLANSSKFSSPPSPGDRIGYYPPGSSEIQWVTVRGEGSKKINFPLPPGNYKLVASDEGSLANSKLTVVDKNLTYLFWLGLTENV